MKRSIHFIFEISVFVKTFCHFFALYSPFTVNLLYSGGADSRWYNMCLIETKLPGKLDHVRYIHSLGMNENKSRWMVSLEVEDPHRLDNCIENENVNKRNKHRYRLLWAMFSKLFHFVQVGVWLNSNPTVHLFRYLYW